MKLFHQILGMGFLMAVHPIASGNDSQAAQAVFEQVGGNGALSQGVVRCIVQDHIGFLWFGTQDGLNKYDGYTFVVYRRDPENPNSLPNNSISALYEDRLGTLWIGTTGGGLSILDRRSDGFRTFQHNAQEPDSLSDNSVSAIHEDRAGNLWIATEFGGLNLFNPQKRTFRRYKHDPLDANSPSEDSLTSVWQDRFGILWIGTRHAGLDSFDPRTGRWSHYRLAQGPQGNSVFAVREDNAGKLWVGTSEGLKEFDRSSHRFKLFNNWSKGQNSSGGEAVNAIYQDSQGNLWLGLIGGLVQITPQLRSTAYRHDARNSHTLGSNIIRSIYEDRSHVLWFGTEGGALSKLNPMRGRFETQRNYSQSFGTLRSTVVKAIYLDRTRALWVGTDDGVARYDARNGTFMTYRREGTGRKGLLSNFVTCIYEDKSGLLWIGTRGGLNSLDRKTGRFTGYHHDPRNPGSISDDLVWFVYEDRAGSLWVGTQGGLNRFNRSTKKFTVYRRDLARPNSLGDDDIRCIAEDSGGMLWIGTRHAGLDHFDPNSGVFTHLLPDSSRAGSLSSYAVYCLLLDREKRLWVGTPDGINLLDQSRTTFTHFTEKDGLPNSTIYGILEDGGGTFWLSTDRGLSRFNPSDRSFRNYDVTDGLQSNEFNGGSFFKAEDGEMFFGGTEGFNSFYPDRLQDSSFEPPVVLTAFRRLDQPLIGLDETTQVEASHRDYALSMEFAALDYTEPEKARYAYKLEGFDREWNYSGSRRLAIYTNLDGGRYVFRVKGTNSDGLWSPHEASLVIHVLPPLWKTWWFLTMVVMATGAAAAWAYQRRVSHFHRARQAQEAFSRLLIESQELERKRIAGELHDSLGQNLIIIRNHALLGLSTSGNPAKTEASLDEIAAATSQALDEVREIARNLRPYQLDRLGLSNALSSIGRKASASSPIRFTIDIDGIDGLLTKESEINLYRIVQESVNNILKHSKATEASVSATRDGREIMVRIQDNGVGFDVDALTGISSDWRGFGLTGIAERARIVGGKYMVRSAPGQGTLVALDIHL